MIAPIHIAMRSLRSHRKPHAWRDVLTHPRTHTQAGRGTCGHRGAAALLVTAAVLAVSAPAAGAATVTAFPSIAGAGTISTAPAYTCVATTQNSSAITLCPSHVLSTQDPFASVVMTLVAMPSPTPKNHWRFVRWEGCQSWTPGSVLCGVGAPASTSHDWFPRAVFVDDVKPTLVSGPDQIHSTIQERTVAFAFGYDEGVTADCRVDGVALPACSSGVAFTGPEGDHTFELQATDASGNVSATTSRPFKIVDTAIAARPGSLTNSRAAMFTYTSVAGTAFVCRRDGQPFAPCPSSGMSFANLADGEHSFEVRAVNGGFSDQLPAAWYWRVDATAPVVSFLPNTATPAQGTLSTLTTATFAFTADEPSSFACSLDNRPATACTTPQVYSDLANGPHSLKVVATDVAGNTGEPLVRNWSIAVSDSDGDGYNANADCNDANPSIAPGRPETLNNDVDENCDGVIEYDRDHDGSRAGADCDDHDARRTPGRSDTPGNAVDEDCDGRDAVKPLEKMSISLAATWRVHKRYTLLKRFVLSGAPRGAQVVVTCRVASCPRKRLTFVTSKASHALRSYVGRRLRPGTVVRFVVSRAGFITAVKTFTIRARKDPLTSVQRCLVPGASQPRAC